MYRDVEKESLAFDKNKLCSVVFVHESFIKKNKHKTIPNAFESMVGIILTFLKTGERLYPESYGFDGEMGTWIGGFDSNGLDVGISYGCFPSKGAGCGSRLDLSCLREGLFAEENFLEEKICNTGYSSLVGQVFQIKQILKEKFIGPEELMELFRGTMYEEQIQLLSETTPPFPEWITEELLNSRDAWGQKISEAYTVFLMPDFSLGEWFKVLCNDDIKRHSGNQTNKLSGGSFPEKGEKIGYLQSPRRSRWVIKRREVIPNSCSCSMKKQIEILEKAGEIVGNRQFVRYRMTTVAEEIVGVVLDYLKTGILQHGKKYVHLTEGSKGCPAVRTTTLAYERHLDQNVSSEKGLVRLAVVNDPEEGLTIKGASEKGQSPLLGIGVALQKFHDYSYPSVDVVVDSLQTQIAGVRQIMGNKFIGPEELLVLFKNTPYEQRMQVLVRNTPVFPDWITPEFLGEEDAWGQKMSEVFTVFLMPGLSIMEWHKIMNKKRSNAKNKGGKFQDGFFLEDPQRDRWAREIPQPQWVVKRRQVVPDSSSKIYNEQVEMVPKKYRVTSAFEEVSWGVLENLMTGEQEIGGSAYIRTFTEGDNGERVCVGFFDASDFSIDSFDSAQSYVGLGVALGTS